MTGTHREVRVSNNNIDDAQTSYLAKSMLNIFKTAVCIESLGSLALLYYVWSLSLLGKRTKGEFSSPTMAAFIAETTSRQTSCNSSGRVLYIL